MSRIDNEDLEMANVAVGTSHNQPPPVRIQSSQEHVLRDYLVHGDSVLLANLIHITRQLSRPDLSDLVLISALQSLSEFDIHNTLPGLQHDFCALWNDIAQGTKNDGELGGPAHTLTNIRPIYIALHPDNWPLSNPLCHDPGHYPGSTPQAINCFPFVNSPYHSRVCASTFAPKGDKGHQKHLSGLS